jgi:hypothetical protein
VIADHVETMLQDARARSPHGFGLPRYVDTDPDARTLLGPDGSQKTEIHSGMRIGVSFAARTSLREHWARGRHEH